jgi:RHS repeat-associated protein
VVEAREYYPFGMVMPNRKTPAAGNSGYRYGFNGKENDDEAYGDDNQQDYGMRVYDPRVGRFLSVDPIFRDYPWNSTYAFAENDVLRNVDLDGREKDEVIQSLYWAGGKAKNLVVGVAEGVYNLVTSPVETASAVWEGVKETGSDLGTIFGTAEEIVYNQATGTEHSGGYDEFHEAVHRTTKKVVKGAALSVAASGGGAVLSKMTKSAKAATTPVKKPAPTDSPNFGGEFLDDFAGGSAVKGSVRQEAIDVVEYAAKNKGGARSGYKGGGAFANDGRDGGQILSKTDATGNPITYKEYDVNPYQKGVNRGTERVVIGSDSRAYYTNDHYKSFTEINQ